MTTPTIGQAGGFLGGLLGGASGTLGFGGGGYAGTNGLQQSIDSLNMTVGRLISTMGGSAPSSGGFPGSLAGGATIRTPAPFSRAAFATGAGMGGLLASVAGYGQQQLPIQLGLNTYSTVSQLGMNTMSNGGYGPANNALMMQAFGMNNQNLNAIANSPMDALRMSQILQFTGGNPLYMNTSLGRQAYGAAASFGLTNPSLSGASSANLAMQMYSPQLSQRMLMYGYNVTPRTFGGGPASSMGRVMQTILQGWYNKNSVSPSMLANTLSLGGRGYLNLQALGLNPTQMAPVLEGYNQLFMRGYTPAQATSMFAQAGKATPAGRAMQSRLSSLGVTTARSDIQAIRNNQAVLTGRDANIANAFNSALQTATGGLYDFNRALSAFMQSTGLGNVAGYGGGLLSVLTGTNHGNMLGGIASTALMARGLFGLFGGGGAAGAAGGAGALGGGAAGLAGLAGATGPFAAGIGAGLGIHWLDQKAIANIKGDPAMKAAGQLAPQVSPINGLGGGIIAWLLAQLGMGKSGSSNGGGVTTGVRSRFAAGGITPGYSPGIDNQLAMLSGGEAVLNPGATRALGPWNIHNLNNRFRPSGAQTSYSNGILHAAAGSVPGGGGGGNPFGYRNPMRRVSGLTPERVDMGVDYAGNGPVYAIGPGIVTNTSQSWAGAVGAPYPGYFISYKLTAGPDKGKYVYVAEDVWPSVRLGQHVTSNTVIGRMRGGIETGWAAPPGTGLTMAAKAGQQSHSGDPGAHPTGYGVNFNQLLTSLGAPGGIVKGPISGNPGSGGLAGGAGSGTTGLSGDMPFSFGTTTGMSGVGFSEAGMIPTNNEIGALGGGGASGGLGIGSGMAGMTSPITSTGGGGAGGSSNAPGGSPARNQAIGKQLAAKFGWASGMQWSSLLKLWNGESGWRNTARNASGAYGIPQALPYTKMPKGAWPPSAGGQANAGLQMTWGMNYIKGRYGNPANAYQTWLSRSPHWYGGGGAPGAGELGIVGDRGPELVAFGQGGGVLQSSKTKAMLSGNYALPQQGGWSGPMQGGSYSPMVNLIFKEGSIVVKTSPGSANSSVHGRAVAREIVNHLHSEQVIAAIARGEKL